MFDVGGGELLFILLAIVLLFGPKKLPELARSFGKGMAQLRKAQADFQRNLNSIEDEITSSVEGIKQPFDSIANEVVESVQDSPVDGTPTPPISSNPAFNDDAHLDTPLPMPAQQLTPIPIQPAQGAVPQNPPQSLSQNVPQTQSQHMGVGTAAEQALEPAAELSQHKQDAQQQTI
jgi:sec-independent protein translocase protein TatA